MRVQFNSVRKQSGLSRRMSEPGMPSWDRTGMIHSALCAPEETISSNEAYAYLFFFAAIIPSRDTYERQTISCIDLKGD